MITADTWLILVAPAFFLILSSLYVSSLLVSGWGETKSRSLMWYPEKLGKLVTHTALTFPAMENLSAWGFPSWH